MSKLDNQPPALPTPRRFEILKGLAIGLVFIALTAAGLFNNLPALSLIAPTLSLALIVLLFCKKRPKMACGMLAAYLAIPLLLYGACLGLVTFG